MEDETTDQEMNRLRAQKEHEALAATTPYRLQQLQQWLSSELDYLKARDAALQPSDNPTLPRFGQENTLIAYLSDWIHAIDEALTELAGIDQA